MGSCAPPRKNYLISYPRSSSNLLVTILSLPDQPDVLAGGHFGGYYFLPVHENLYMNKETCGIDPSKWTSEQREQTTNCYKKCYESFQDHLREAQSTGKGVFIKEHANFFLNPLEMAKWCTSAADAEPWSVDEAHYPFDAPTSTTTETSTSRSFSHTPGNTSVFSDEFLLGFQPTLLIRHPALMFPSLLRTEIDLSDREAATAGVWTAQNEICCTLRWTRGLYDWYSDKISKMAEPPRSASSEESVTWPIVLDADDFTCHPQMLRRYCRIVGLDETKLKFSWDCATAEEKSQIPVIGRRMLSTLNDSTDIIKSKTSVGLDLDEEVKKWRVEFGQELAEKIEKWVRDAMPDYEYLRTKRMLPGQDD